jgi:ABC-2 type transport system ATP-binding protein
VGVTDGPMALQRVLSELGAAGIDLHDAGMRRPTLDDVFLTLTGRSTETTTSDSDDEADGGTGGTKKRRGARRGNRQKQEDHA